MTSFLTALFWLATLGYLVVGLLVLVLLGAIAVAILASWWEGVRGGRG